ncbi:protein O-mannosyl-transferase TMTC4 isoform X2 [Lutzomyia longipalpis]|uniref:protein O-mannosyl-transferase TMTC4 isoform X2 n=1 Tax=Lutzomyia longipalpis TaxID=7200 RepID=UPI0024835EC3|nr:protein O-mannosyl-transferase TMTC4 isoform X2 [Lutzomyia longipalpis]
MSSKRNQNIPGNIKFILLAVLCLICYGSHLDGEFVFDDTVAIVKNWDVTGRTSLGEIFRHDFWGYNITDTSSHKSYRPLTILTFRLEHNLYGLYAFRMKGVNLFLHILDTWLIIPFWRSYFPSGEDQWVAFGTAAMFAIHPIHTEAVSGIVGRAELLVACTFLLSLILYNTQIAQKSSATVLAYLGFIFLASLGLLFKENGITISLMAIATEVILNTNLLQKLRDLEIPLNFPKRVFARICILLGVCSALCVFRLWIMEFQSPNFKVMDNPVAASDEILTKSLSQVYLYALNYWIMLCPDWLSFDWALGSISLVESFLDIRCVFIVIFCAFLLGIIWTSIPSKQQLLAISLIVVPFLPACGIIKLGFVIAERVLYLSSIGHCFLVILGVRKLLYNFPGARKFIAAVLIVSAMIFVARTRVRAKEWTTEELLFSSALRVCPNNAKVHYNIARLATDRGQKEKAFKFYHQAIELFPDYESAIMNLGNLYREIGEFQKAEELLLRSVELLEEFPAAWMNLGIVQAALKKYNQSLESYQKALKYRKHYPMCLYNIGNLFIEMRNTSMAHQFWSEAIALNPRHGKAWANILALLDNEGQTEEVVRMSAIALQHIPNDPAIFFTRANAFGKLGDFQESERLFLRAIELRPNYAMYYANLGVLYHRWRRHSQAEEYYRKALKVDPNLRSVRENLSKLKKK